MPPRAARPSCRSVAEPRDIALIGPLADDAPSMLGSWAGLSRTEDVASIRTALAARIGVQHLRYAPGTGVMDGSDADMAAAVNAAQQADVVVLALGEDAGTMTGEASSRSWLGLPGRQQELLEKVVATGRPVVLIVFSGRPLTIPWAFEHVPTILAAWFPGIQAGPALVNTLFGDANPSGRLVVSWPRSSRAGAPLLQRAQHRPAGRRVRPQQAIRGGR